MENNNKDWYNALTGLIFTCLVFTGFFLLKVFWNGCQFIWRNRKSKIMMVLAIITIAITVYFITKYDTNDSRQALSLVPIPVYLFITGCINKIFNFYLNEYSKIFESINFRDKGGNFPKILKRIKSKKDKKVREILIIKSMIPFENWTKNKDILEQAFNSKLAILSTKNRQVIKIIKLGEVS
jgi:hypothetical protein